MKRLISYIVWAIILLVAAVVVHDYAGEYLGRVFEDGVKKSVELYMQVHKPEGNLQQHCEEMLKKNENQ